MPATTVPKKRFQYEVMWEAHESWQEVITERWNATALGLRLDDLRAKLSFLSRDLEGWSKDTFGSVRKEIRHTKQELENLRNDPARVGPSCLEIKLNARLVELYHREEVMWRQRSRIQWLSAGDKNTKFFHMRASLRRKKNMIKALINSLGVQADDPHELKTMVQEFYQNLYTSEGITGVEEVLAHVPCKVTEAMNVTLTAPYTNEEVRVALFQMFPTKAPGPDGFPAHFYQRHWDLCGDDVTRAVLRVVRGEESAS